MQAKVYSPTPANLRRLAGALRRGELVAIPTETVYGLAGNALDARACRTIFKAKGRPANDPLIVHVLDLAQAEQLAEFNFPARKLARRFWPGPLTLVLPKKSCVPGIVTSGGPSVALRSPAHPLARRLLRLARIPLAAPSANPFGYISPTLAVHVTDGLGRRIKHVLDGGACAVGVESTVLDLTDPLKPRLLRPGAVTAGMLEKVLKVAVRQVRRSPGRKRKLSPGMLQRHYSPHTPLRLKKPGPRLPRDVAGIFLRKPAGRTGDNVYWLSRRGTLAEVSRNLYQVLRQADRGGHRQIWIERLAADASGLALALNDRLKRAAARRRGQPAG
jgi:L-threonylcarbamoyladenylate synthase